MSDVDSRSSLVPPDALLDAIEAGYWELRADGSGLHVSPRLLEIFGISGASELSITQRVRRCVDPDDLAEAAATAAHDGAAGRSFSYDVRIRREDDGATRTIRVRGRRYTDGPLAGTALGAAFDVTESRELWGELRATRAQLEAAERIGHTGSWSWHLRSGEVRWSDETYRILGVPRESKPSFDLVLAMAVDSTLQAQFEAHVQAALERDVPYDFEMPVRGADGGIRIIHTLGAVDREADGTPIRMVGTIRDVTDARSAERELREREARFRLLAESSPDGVFLTDALGNATYANDRLLGWFRMDFAEFASGGWLRRVHPDDLATIEALTAPSAPRRRPFNYEYRIVVDGNERWVHVRTEPLVDADDNLLGHVGSVEDTTLEHRAAAERALLEDKLQQARKLESVGLLAGGIAHDFNNLLVGVLANASFARESVAAGTPVAEALLDIERAAQRAADLTRQLLSYAGRASTRRSVVDLGAVVSELGGLLGARIPPAVDFRVEFTTAQANVVGDETELRQIVMNLVTNAVDAIDGNGRVCVRLGLEEMAPESLAGCVLGAGREPGPYVCVTVVDTGRGMPADVVARMFDPFFSTKGTGRGLGLAATLGLLNSHGGCVRVDSRPGAGTTISVLLPATEDEVTPVPTLPTRSQASGGAGRILLADDDADGRRAARRVLERAGYEVVEVGDGREAVERFAAAPEGWSCVLLDLTMPVMTGDAALREIRARAPQMPILLMSGYTAEDVAATIASDPRTEFLHKPYRVAELLTAIAGLRSAGSGSPTQTGA
jgi:PAS domain S-box-containing protein